MVVNREHFEWLAGEPRTFISEADSGTLKNCRFCGDCGTRVLNELDKLPTTFNLKPGTLDDTSWFQPVAHVWVSRKQTWVAIPDSLTQFDENPVSRSLANKARE
jgi:hypothetical protein